MLYKLLLQILISLLFSVYVYSQALVIDHTCVDMTQIPANYIDSVKTNIKWHYAHTSHGNSLTCGLDLLEQSDPTLNVEVGDAYLPDVENALCVYNGNSLFTYILPEGYWAQANGRSWTYSTLSSNPLNVSMFVWCGECATNSLTQTQDYLDSISSFEADFPDVQFVYCTGNAQTDGAEGYTRYMNNELIREYCLENDKILFDFADLDCWYEGEFNYYIYEGDTIPLQHTAFAGQDLCGHVNEISNILKGKATWWMLASLAGWERKISVNSKVYLEGPFNGSDMNAELNSSGSLPLSQPFNIAPWNYNGSESVVAIPNPDVVDWVLVELRDVPPLGTPTGETTVGQRAGFLLKDGSIVDINGISSLKFNAAINQDLYIVIRHQSHLDIVGANPAILNGNTYDYDFTTSELKVYGGINGHKEIGPGIWGMFSGDGNKDGVINIVDKFQTWLLQSGQTGYKTADFDMNGKVNNQDKNENWLGNIYKESQIPE